MDIYEEIQKGQDKANDLFKKALPSSLNEMVDDIKKAKSAQVGEIRTWSGVKMRKEATGWVPVKEGVKGSAQSEAGDKAPVSTVDLREHAKNASEQALMNATKTSPDPAVREAAHKEMMRRKNEEAGETFKAPEDNSPLTEEERGVKEFDKEHAKGGPIDKENTARENKAKKENEKKKEGKYLPDDEEFIKDAKKWKDGGQMKPSEYRQHVKDAELRKLESFVMQRPFNEKQLEGRKREDLIAVMQFANKNVMNFKINDQARNQALDWYKGVAAELSKSSK
jgi:hypothetical protein